jgi:response regulator RpfG family c-di-GMP phosphodiesterase
MIIGKKVTEIRTEFEKCEGYHFDPALVAHFLSILDCKFETVGS